MEMRNSNRAPLWKWWPLGFTAARRALNCECPLFNITAGKKTSERGYDGGAFESHEAAEKAPKCATDLQTCRAADRREGDGIFEEFVLNVEEKLQLTLRDNCW